MKSCLSDSPWNKTYNKAALWDPRCFLRKKERYKGGAPGADYFDIRVRDRRGTRAGASQ